MGGIVLNGNEVLMFYLSKIHLKDEMIVKYLNFIIFSNIYNTLLCTRTHVKWTT